MIHHDELASLTQQMPGCLDQLWQGDGEFMPRYRLLWVWVQASMAHSTVGRITHNSTEHAGREKRRHLTHVTLDDPYPALQAITDHILLGEHSQRALQLQTDAAEMRETTCQEKRHHTAASAEVEAGGRRWSRDKVCQ
jgi:hypothetical protein